MVVGVIHESYSLIPTRLNSTRLPKKCLLPINGIQWCHTYRRAKLCKSLDVNYVL